MTDTHPGTTGEAQGEAQGEYQYPAPSPIQFSSPAAPETVEQNGNTGQRISRKQAKEMMRLAQDSGVPLWLDHMNFEATVKALSFADKTMLGGIEPRLQAEITAGFNARGITTTGSAVTFHDMLRGVGTEERLANAVCCAGFISPRLTLTEGEADLANNEDVWWVGDIHIEDRRKYSGIVLGTNAEEAKRIANFLSDRVAGTGNS